MRAGQPACLPACLLFLQAPEVLLGGSASAASDVYAFGLVMLEVGPGLAATNLLLTHGRSCKGHRGLMPNSSASPLISAPQLLTWRLPWPDMEPWVLISHVLEGRRPETPAWRSAPGADAGTVQQHDAYCVLMRWVQGRVGAAGRCTCSCSPESCSCSPESCANTLSPAMPVQRMLGARPSGAASFHGYRASSEGVTGPVRSQCDQRFF